MVQAMRHVLGLGASVRDTQVLYCGFTQKTMVSPLKRKPDCPCEHIAYERVDIHKPLNQCTLGELAENAGFGPELPPELTFRLEPFDYVDQSTCCGKQQPVRRFCVNGDSLGRCRQCGGELRSLQFYRSSSVPAAHVDLRTCLWRLGAVALTHVVVAARDRAVLVQAKNRKNKERQT